MIVSMARTVLRSLVLLVIDIVKEASLFRLEPWSGR